MNKEFYVYLHKDDAGNVFYVGKGKGQRAWMTRGRGKRWRHILRDTCQKCEPNVVIVQDSLTEVQALCLEYALISALRESFLLANLITGNCLIENSGVIAWNKGLKASEETRRKLSEAAKNRSPEDRAKMSVAQQKRFENPKEREKASLKNTNNPKVKAAALKGSQTAAQQPVWNKGLKTPEDVCKKQSDAKKALFATLTQEERKALVGRPKSDETKKKLSEASRKQALAKSPEEMKEWVLKMRQARENKRVKQHTFIRNHNNGKS